MKKIIIQYRFFMLLFIFIIMHSIVSDSLIFCSILRAETEVVSLDGTWKITTDAKNEGKQAKHWEQPLKETKDIPVPGVIQQIYPDYHGVVWYERSFPTPKNGNNQGRYILRCWQVEYYCDIWLNGQLIGSHEGGEAMFELDVTKAIKSPGETNRLVIRVINVTEEPIDGFTLKTIPRRNNTNEITAGCGYASGGIVDSVELLCVPSVRLSDLHLIPNWKTGEITVRAAFENSHQEVVSGTLALSAFPTSGSELTNTISIDTNIVSGSSVVEAKITIPDFKLWQLNDPNLYWVIATWKGTVISDRDRRVARCGFRDFRFENGYFRLNGKRIYVKCSHSGSDSPITHRIPLDPDLYRKDILLSKAMNFNMIRYIAGMPRRFQLDLCDELGFMVYDECLAGWMLGDSPQRKERLYRQTEGMIRRDWNHPSVVIWGLLNENFGQDNVLDAAAFLPHLRKLDPDRLVILNSGSFDPFVAGKKVVTADFSLWRRKDSFIMPAVLKNYKPTFTHDGTQWKTDTLFMHPGDMLHESVVVKWTAPKSGTFDIQAKFFDVVVDGVATVDIHLYQGITPIYKSYLNLNGKGKNTEYQAKRTIKKGEEISVVIGIGDGAGTGDTTAVELIITDDTGKTYDLKKDYSFKANPNGVWSYGYLPLETNKNLASFRLLKTGQETLSYQGKSIGRYANPGVQEWQDDMADTHPYQAVPQTKVVIDNLRKHNPRNGKPIFLSEYGIGSGVDLFRLTRLFEQNGGTESADAKHYRWRYDCFMEDWNQWNLNELFSSQEDYFQKTLAWMAEQRRLGINALRANPLIVGHSVTGTHDQGISGEGLTTLFRELKPGTIDTMADIFAPLRFCLFVEPVHVYNGDKARFEAVLVNEDVLKPGRYPVRFQIVGPNNTRLFDKTVTIEIPVPEKGKENPIVLPPVFDEEIKLEGLSGEYKFTAVFQEGAAAAGGWEHFFISDKKEMPVLSEQYIVWGNDHDLLNKLKALGIKATLFSPQKEQVDQNKKSETFNTLFKDRPVILVGKDTSWVTRKAFEQLYNLVNDGASVCFLSMNVFKEGKSTTALLPFDKKGEYPSIPGWNWLYHKDDWVKRHSFFKGMPCGDLLDYCYYREIVPNNTFKGQTQPNEIVAGAFNTTQGYASGLTMAVYHWGKGKIVLTTFRIQENLPTDPAAEHLLKNILSELK